MCCIIHRPKGANEISEWTLKRLIRINPDGWGVSYYKDGRLKVLKSLVMDEALDQVRKLEKEDIEFLFHVRYATHGEVTIHNCHPYDLNNGVVFHNGKINIHCYNKALSDTYYFSQRVNKYLKRKRSIGWIVNRFKRMIGPSRLAFMSNDGKILKFGDWVERNGCSFSKSPEAVTYYNSEYERPAWPDRDPEWVKKFMMPASSLYNVATPKTYFERAVENCKNNVLLYRGLIKELSEQEMVKLAMQFPDECAEYLSRTMLV